MESIYLYKFLYSLIPCFAYFLIIKYPEIHLKKVSWKKSLLLIIFLIYIYIVFQITGIDSIYLWNPPNFNSINLTLFDTFGEISYLLNIFLFLPLGFLIPIIWDSYQSLTKTTLVGSFCSLTIELLQLFCGRATDIDDLLMNTLGCLLGYLTWKALSYLFRKKENTEDKKNIVGNSPIIWIFLLLFGYLFLYP